LLHQKRIVDEIQALTRRAGSAEIVGSSMRRQLIMWCIGLAFAASPVSMQMSSDGSGMSALAAKGGNGGAGGNGGDNGGGGGRAGGAAKGEAGDAGRASAPGQSKQDGSSAIGKGHSKSIGAADAKSFGKLNGFMHASPTALANASINSPLGAIAQMYAGQLGSYLSIDQTSATPEEREAAEERLEAAASILGNIANKPLSDKVVAAVNTRLGELAKQSSLPDSDPAISAALSNLSSDDPAQKSRNDMLAAKIAQMAANSASPAAE
jgi:hypothetical protein